jgi:hypothetical protein
MSPNPGADHSLLDGKRQGVEHDTPKMRLYVDRCLLSGLKHLMMRLINEAFDCVTRFTSGWLFSGCASRRVNISRV